MGHYFETFSQFYNDVQDAGNGLFDGHSVESAEFIFNCGSLYNKSIITKLSPIFIKYDCYDYSSLKKIYKNYKNDSQKMNNLIQATFFENMEYYLFNKRIYNANIKCGIIPYIKTTAKHIFYNGCVIKNKNGLNIERLYGRDNVFVAKFAQFAIACLGEDYYIRFHQTSKEWLPLTKNGQFILNGVSHDLCEPFIFNHGTLTKFSTDTLMYLALKGIIK